jgi:hypothetical protein
VATVKNALSSDATPCDSWNKRRFGGTFYLYHQGGKNLRTRNNVSSNFLRSVHRLLVTANVVPSSPILVTLMMETIRTSEMSVLALATRCHIPEYGILHSRRRENLKSYIALTGWAL